MQADLSVDEILTDSDVRELLGVLPYHAVALEAPRKLALRASRTRIPLQKVRNSRLA
jgi:hypothetical protein